MIEHYSDGKATGSLISTSDRTKYYSSYTGDLVNCDTPTGILPASDEALAIWGPAVRECTPDAHLYIIGVELGIDLGP